MEKPIKINSIYQLIEIINHSENVREFFIELVDGAKSWKRITTCNKLDVFGRKKFVIINEIDDTKQTLSVKNLCNSKYSPIYSAIICGSFYLFDNNENHDLSDTKFY